MNRTNRALMVLLAIVALGLGAFAWQQYRRADKAEAEIDLNATRMLHEVFNAKRDLRVGQLSGIVVASTQYSGRFFRPVQSTRAPVTVNYLLDLRKIGKRDLSWDAKNQKITVRIPDVAIERPNIDFAAMQVQQEGVWIGRDAGIVMQQTAVRRIAGRALDRAKDEKNIGNARRQAAQAITELIERPLSTIGYDRVEVRVLFPWDGTSSSERWDVSRSPSEVLANSW